jgi:hypothetical protein
LVVHRAINTTVERSNFFHVFGGILMKRNVLQLALGLAAMAVVLVGLESQANAFGSHGGRGSCGSHGGLFSRGSHGSNGSNGSHGGLFHRHGGSCGETSCCEEKKECGGCEAKEETKCEEKSCGCESSCNSGCGRHHRHHGCGGGGCESSCGSCGGDSGCSECDKKGESAPAAPKDEKDGGKSPEMRQAAPKGA